MSAPDTVLTVSALAKTYAGTASGVRGVDFRLEPGTFFTLLGPSGCGKTTTLRCIAGLETPDGGAIRLGPTPFFDAGAGVNVPLNRRNIGMVFQSYAIWPHLTVFENVAFPLRVGKERHSSAEIARLVKKAVASVDLAGFETRSATQLSGGQQQRVALARAIVRTPSLLLLDEPLSNLDALLRDEMRAELKRIQGEIGVTTIYVTHDQSEALEMSDRVAVMSGGRIVQLGTPQDIYFRPANGFVASFMGSTNVLPGRADAAVPEGALSTVALENGRTLTCRFSHSVRAGDRVSVSIRPEAVALAATGHGAANQLSGTVASAGFLGHLVRYTIDVGGGLVLHASVGAQAMRAPGSQVSVEVPFDAAQALPAGDEGGLPEGGRGARAAA